MRWRHVLFAAASIFAIGGSNAAFAQAAAQPAGEAASSGQGGFEDIVVTATRREENIQNVPVAVSAFTPDNLARAGVVKTEDLARVTPSFQISRFVGSPTATSFGIRGQRTNDIRVNADSAVVAYVAEVPQHLPFGLGQTGFLDVQSVQILRGPQGTLFGRNSTGGAVLLTPNTPTDEFEGSVKFNTGNYSKIEGQAVANIPLAEGVGIRIAGIAGHRDGWLKNRSGFPDGNEENYRGARGSFQVESGDFKSTFYGDYLKFDGTGQAGKLVAVNPAGLGGLAVPGGIATLQAILRENETGDFWSNVSTRPLISRTKVWGVSNTTTYRFSDSFLLKNIVGYRNVYNLFDAEANGTPFTLHTTRITGSSWQFTEELQAQFDTGPVHVIGGLFYFREKGTDNGYTESLRGLILPIGAGGALVPLGAEALYDHHVTNTARSAFLEGTLDITDTLHLTLGGRYTDDKRYRSGANLNYRDPAYYPARFAGTSCRYSVGGVPLPVARCFYDNKVDFQKFTHNITLRYEISDEHQTYASWRTGYRAGGFALEATNPLNNAAYQPETVNNYEVGYKGRARIGANAGVRLNLAAYLSKYNDIQKNQSTRTPPPESALVTRTVNAAKATIYGLEAEGSAYIGDNLNLDASYTYSNAKYDSWPALDTAGNPVDLSDTPWGYLPKHKVSASVRYTIPLGDENSLAFQPTLSWNSSQHLEETPGPGTLQKGYALVNGRVEYNIGKLTFAVWGANLFNKKYYVATQNIYSALGYTNGYVGEPRTYGVELSGRF